MVIYSQFSSKAEVLFLLICGLLLPLWGFVFVPNFVVHCFVSFLVLQSSRLGREGWLLYFVFLVSCDCYVALPCGAVGWSAVCDCAMWYFLIILTRFFYMAKFPNLKGHTVPSQNVGNYP